MSKKELIAILKNSKLLLSQYNLFFYAVIETYY